MADALIEEQERREEEEKKKNNPPRGNVQRQLIVSGFCSFGLFSSSVSRASSGIPPLNIKFSALNGEAMIPPITFPGVFKRVFEIGRDRIFDPFFKAMDHAGKAVKNWFNKDIVDPFTPAD